MGSTSYSPILAISKLYRFIKMRKLTLVICVLLAVVEGSYYGYGGYGDYGGYGGYGGHGYGNVVHPVNSAYLYNQVQGHGVYGEVDSHHYPSQHYPYSYYPRQY